MARWLATLTGGAIGCVVGYWGVEPIKRFGPAAIPGLGTDRFCAKRGSAWNRGRGQGVMGRPVGWPRLLPWFGLLPAKYRPSLGHGSRGVASYPVESETVFEWIWANAIEAKVLNVAD